jgi:uncharacterized coiled-coil protein SlyX
MNQPRPNNRRPINRRPNNRYNNRYINNNAFNANIPRNTPMNAMESPNVPLSPSQSGSSGFGTMMMVLAVVAFIAVLLYTIYTYGSDLYTKFSDANFYILNWDNISEEEKSAVKCKKGCDKGKCVKGDGTECESDADCALCTDNKGGFYGTVPPSADAKMDERLKALEEDKASNQRKIEDLEKTIQRRNEEVDKLNRYIDYVNQTRTSGTTSTTKHES